MAKGHKPVAGSRAFWPRKRANRIYQNFSYSEEYLERISGIIKDVKPVAFCGYKAGMLHVCIKDNKKGSATYGQEVVKAVTVLDIPPVIVCGIKVYEKGGYGKKTKTVIWAENLDKNLARKVDLPKKIDKNKAKEIENEIEKASDIRLLVHTVPKESGIGKKKPELFEIALSGDDIKKKWEYAKSVLGKQITIRDVFDEGEYVDVKAVDKGKGYQGVVKRFGVKIRGRKHNKKRRHIGNLAPRTPARVLPGAVAMAGQLGFQTRTEYNKKILKIGDGGISPKGGFVSYGIVPNTYLLVDGSVPGSKKRLVMMRKAVRKPLIKEPEEIVHISLKSQQG